jgi:hypothetical protein
MKHPLPSIALAITLIIAGCASPKSGNINYPTARKVPGRVGYVVSPYSNKVIDVREWDDRQMRREMEMMREMKRTGKITPLPPDPNARQVPSGTLLADPYYPKSAKKYFRVP